MILKKQFLIVVLMLLLLATACTNSLLTKSAYINNYETWIAKLKSDYKEYKKDDWIEAEANFKTYSEGEYNRFKDQFTEDERQKVDNLTGQYWGILAKSKADQVKLELKGIINKALGMFQELKKE